MIGKIRSTLIGLGLIASLALGTSMVGAANASVALTAGTLAITAPATDFSYASSPLTGDTFDLTSSFAVGVNDPTGTGNGWKLLATIGALTDATNDTIPAANHVLTGATVSNTTGNAPPVNTLVTYPQAIPTTSASIFSANAGTGKGKSTETFATKLTVPADAAAGSYSALMTVTISSGP
jgi:hypothetical protein